MKMKGNGFGRKSIVFLILMTMGLLGGCSGNKATAVDDSKEQFEYCREMPVALPEEIKTVYDMSDEEKGLLIGRTESGTELVWESEDMETWKKKADIPEEFSNSIIMEAAIIDEEHFIVSRVRNLDNTGAQEAKKEYYIGTLAEKLEWNQIDMGEIQLNDLQVVGDIIYGLNHEGKVASYDYRTGAYKVFDKTAMYVNTFCILDDQVLAIGPDAAEMYDIKSGKVNKIDQTLNKKLIEIIGKNSSQFIVKVGYDSGNKNLYCMTQQGIYCYYFQQKEFKTILFGRYHAFGNIENQVTDFSVESAGVIYVSLLTKDQQSETYIYTQEPEGIKVSSGYDKQLVLYSLVRDALIQERVSTYNASQDKVYIQYIYGVTYANATTKQDAIKKLNAELLDGKGPDILILDGLPVEALMEKEILADTSDLLEDDNLFSNIAKPYQKGKEIYGIPMYFKLMAIHGDEEVVGSISSIETLSDGLLKEQKKYPESLIIDKYRQGNYVDVIYNAYYQDLFNQEELNKDKLSLFYEQLKKINDIAAYDFTVEVADKEQAKQADYSDINVESNSLTEQLLETKDLRVSISGVTSEMDLARLYSYGKDQDFEYSFFERDGQPAMVPNLVFGINADTKNMKEAKAFLKESLLQQSFKSYYDESSGFSINKKVMDENFKDSGVKTEVETGKNEMVAIESKEVKGKQKKAFYELIAGLNQTKIPDAAVKDIIMEQAQKYVNGEENLEQCTNTAVEKVNLYLTE